MALRMACLFLPPRRASAGVEGAWPAHDGHGGQVKDTNSDEKDSDRMDETWVLFNRQLVDDELHNLWAKFKPGVRILVKLESLGFIGEFLHRDDRTEDLVLYRVIRLRQTRNDRGLVEVSRGTMAMPTEFDPRIIGQTVDETLDLGELVGVIHRPEENAPITW